MTTISISYIGRYWGAEQEFIDTDGAVKIYKAPYLLAVEPMGQPWVLKQVINYPKRGHPTFTYSWEKAGTICDIVRERGFIDDAYWVRGPSANATTRAQE